MCRCGQVAHRPGQEPALVVPAHDHGRALHQEAATRVDAASAVHDVTHGKDGVDSFPTDEVQYDRERLVLGVDIAQHGEASRGHGCLSASRPLIRAPIWAASRVCATGARRPISLPALFPKHPRTKRRYKGAADMPAAAAYAFRFFRAGGVDQVDLSEPDVLKHLGALDLKLWLSLACPTKGLEVDARTLEFIDADHDGRIRPPDVLAAVAWANDVFADV